MCKIQKGGRYDALFKGIYDGDRNILADCSVKAAENWGRELWTFLPTQGTDRMLQLFSLLIALSLTFSTVVLADNQTEPIGEAGCEAIFVADYAGYELELDAKTQKTLIKAIFHVVRKVKGPPFGRSRIPVLYEIDASKKRKVKDGVQPYDETVLPRKSSRWILLLPRMYPKEHDYFITYHGRDGIIPYNVNNLRQLLNEVGSHVHI